MGSVNASRGEVTLNRARTVSRSEAPTALLYLRVSTPSQVKTDYDPEGISIPAQRLACQRKAEQMGVEIVDEYVEPGRSATSMDKRVAFQAMLERIRTKHDVNYVIVYKLSRMNRNRIDDALVLMSLRRHNVTLASATEHIDGSPSGQLMHGILAAYNEFRSAEDGADIRYKMGEKARRGGTLGRAPLGYRNVRIQFEDREIRTVELDPERAHYIPLAFDLYATGNYSLDDLVETLTERGLRTRAGRFPAGPVSSSKLHEMLRDRYYLGYIAYKGEEYKGRHPAIVTEEVFDRVQDVLDSRSTKGVRQRTHQHYLKGTLWCGRCHEEGRESRMILQRAIGRRGGEYFYFFCRARQDHQCQSRYLDIDVVEDKVLEHYAVLHYPSEFSAKVRATLRETLEDQDRAAKLRREQLNAELDRLSRQESNLLDLVSDGNVASPEARRRLSLIGRRREKLETGLSKTNEDLQAGAAFLEAAFDLLVAPQQLYRLAGDDVRRQLNQVFFERLYVIEEGISDQQLQPPFDEINLAYEETFGGSNQDRSEAVPSELEEISTGRLALALLGEGSNKAVMVEVMGLEPTTSTMRT